MFLSQRQDITTTFCKIEYITKGTTTPQIQEIQQNFDQKKKKTHINSQETKLKFNTGPTNTE